MNIHQLVKQSKENKDLLTIEATVITGFEFLALDECREKCKPVSIAKAKGRIFFNIPFSDFNKVLTLRAVDNVLLVLETVTDIPFEGNKVKDLEIIKSLVETVDWDTSLSKWSKMIEFKGILYPYKSATILSNDGLSSNKGLMDTPAQVENSEKIPGENDCNEAISTDEKAASAVSSNILPEVEQNNSIACAIEQNRNLNSVEIPNILFENVVDEEIESTTELHKTCDDQETDLLISNEEEIAKHRNLVDSSKDIKEEEEGENNALLEPEKTTHLCNISDKETLKVLKEEEISCSQLDNVLEANEAKSYDLRKTECTQNKSNTFTKENSKADTTVDVTTEKMSNLQSENKDLNEEQDTSHETNSAKIEECTTKIEAEDRSDHNKQQPRGKNKYFDRRKPAGRRGQRGSIPDPCKPQEDDGILKFRATCYRIGDKHSFSSMEAACEFGGKLQDKFGWTVNLTRYNLNVVLNIDNKQGYICVAVTQESLHRRNITHFSNTTLRATMCYNLFRLAEPMTGEIVIDPLCGGGSIPIEGALSFPNTYHICGDYNNKAIDRTRANIDYINRTKTQMKAGAVLWDIKHLPVKAQSVDILVTDLPFGKRSGSKRDNLRLYSKVLFELAKVVKTGTGRACLLTYDRTSLTRALSSQNIYWREIRQFGVNQGGLFSTVFLLLRRATLVAETKDRVSEKQNVVGTVLKSSPESNLITTEENETIVSTLQDESTASADSSEKNDKDASADSPEKNDKDASADTFEKNDKDASADSPEKNDKDASADTFEKNNKDASADASEKNKDASADASENNDKDASADTPEKNDNDTPMENT